jgi:DNA-binding protein YbaB
MTGIGQLSNDPEEAQARLQQWADGFAEKARRYQEAAARTEEMRLTATSPNGAVTVTVRADGGVTGLEFTDRASSMPLPELSAMVLDTMHRAQSGIAEQVGEVYDEELGDEDPQTRALLLENLRDRFPATEDTEEDHEERYDAPEDPEDPDDYSDDNPLR